MSSEHVPVLKPEVPMSLPAEQQPEADQASTKLYMEAAKGAVKILNGSDNTGSGFLVDDTHVVTSARTVIASQEQFAVGPDGRRHRLEIQKMDDLKDLAVLTLVDGKITGAHALPLADHAGSLKKDDQAAALSFPQKAETTMPYLSPGYVRGATAPVALLEYIDGKVARNLYTRLQNLDMESKIDAASYLEKPQINLMLHSEPGSAGAPVLQKDGTVVGVTTLLNGYRPQEGQTLAAPVEDLKGLLAGSGSFSFKYKNAGADWTEQYLSDWQNDRVKAAVDTTLTGLGVGLAYWGASRFPLPAAAFASTFGAFKLTSDLQHMLQSADRPVQVKYGISALADLGTVSGAALAFVPGFRTYGLALSGFSLAGRAAADFIRNHRLLDECKRIDGDPARPPFVLDTLLKK